MAEMVVALETPRIARPLAGASLLLALGVVHALVAVRYPFVDLAVVGVCVFAFFPQVPRAVLIAGVALAPTLNPPLVGLAGAGVGGGRVYALQALLLLIIVGAFAVAARNGMHALAASVAVLASGIALVQTVGRTHAGPAWVYRPLQLFLVAFAVRVLFAHRSHRGLVLALAWGAVIGCTLASIHALAPALDPFARSRPRDIPFVSAIGSFARATGGFTYPNNLGTFAAYAVLLGAAAWLLGRPALPRALAASLVGAGGSALLLSGSRAAGLGLLCGLLYLTFRLAPQRRALILLAELVVGLVVVLGVLSTPSARDVARERLDSAVGTSLSLRLEGTGQAVDAFLDSPVIGTGATESRIDNFWVLYLSQAGVIGAVLFLLLARVAFRPGGEEKANPELWVAVLLTLAVSGLLQDSLGQTLVTWFPGALLGLCRAGTLRTRCGGGNRCLDEGSYAGHGATVSVPPSTAAPFSSSIARSPAASSAKVTVPPGICP